MTAAIIQTRMSSSRLPGKALIDICGKPALQRVIERVRYSNVDDVIVATTTNKADDAIMGLCEGLNCHCYRGNEEDVLSRVLEAAKSFGADTIVEITADCPLIDWNHIDFLLSFHKMNLSDMTTNILERDFPRGYDIRIFDTATLERVDAEVGNPIDRQHVSTWMYLNPEGKKNYRVSHWQGSFATNRPDIEVTLDTPEDLELIRWLYSFEGQGYNLELTCEQVISLIDTYPEMYKKVSEIKRKDYFQELQEYYAKAETNKNEVQNVQNNNSRQRPAGKRGRPAKR